MAVAPFRMRLLKAPLSRIPFFVERLRSALDGIANVQLMSAGVWREFEIELPHEAVRNVAVEALHGGGSA